MSISGGRNRHERQSGNLNVTASELDMKIAKSSYLPSLSLSAGIGTNHTSGTDFTFTEQLKNGWNNSIGLTLIPVGDSYKKAFADFLATGR